MAEITTRIVTSESAGLHPMVAQVIRQLEQNVEGLTPWDRISVETRPHTLPRSSVTGWWHTVMAERHPGTLAATTVQVFVRTSGPRRGRFVGGTVYRVLTEDRKIKTWADLRSRGW